MPGKELTTIDQQVAVLAGERAVDPQFQHALLCQLGLPRSPTLLRTFERTSGKASLRLQAGSVFVGGKWVDQPLPSGTRPRLVLINVCSEAVRTQNPDVDIGDSVREFLRRLGIDASGDSMRRFRKEMLALSVCHMTLALPTARGGAQIDAKPVDSFEAWLTSEDGQRALWPGRLRLTDKFFESLVEHAVPLDSAALGQLQNSALALDVYSWLAHRLPRVRENNGVVLSWAALQDQFGQEYKQKNNFKRDFVGAVRKAVDVYKDARVEELPGGLKLFPSPPSVPRVSVAVRALPDVEKKAVGSRGRVAFSNLVLDRARESAPGWDMQWLQDKFWGWVGTLDKPLQLSADKAFVGWVKGFTKNKRPP